MELTQLEFDNFLYKIQCCIADKSDALRYNLRIGNSSENDINLFIFANIYLKILSRLGFEQKCMSEDKFCAIIRYLRWYCKDCAC